MPTLAVWGSGIRVLSCTSGSIDSRLSGLADSVVQSGLAAAVLTSWITLTRDTSSP